MGRQHVLIIFSFVSLISVSKAQELTPGYLDSVKQFFNSKAFVESLQTVYGSSGNLHLAIVLHPVSRPNPTTEELKSFKESFSRQWYTVIYHWAPKVRPATADTIMFKADSLVLTEQEKQEIMKSETSLAASQFKWTNDYFPGATFPVQTADSMFAHSRDLPNGLYAFSMPVFLRNNTFCIFSYAWITHGGGHHYYEVYKKINRTRWWKFGEFGGGDW